MGSPIRSPSHPRSAESCPKSFKFFFHVFEEVFREQTSTKVGFHSGGTLGGNRHYWHPDRPAIARRSGGERGSPPVPVHQSHEAAWTCYAQLPRHVQGLSSRRVGQRSERGPWLSSLLDVVDAASVAVHGATAPVRSTEALPVEPKFLRSSYRTVQHDHSDSYVPLRSQRGENRHRAQSQRRRSTARPATMGSMETTWHATEIRK